MKTLALFTLLCLPLCAQDAELDPVTKGWIDGMTRELELSPEQVESITKIFKEMNNKVGSVLTEEQKRGYEQLRQGGQGRRDRGGRGGGGNWMERFMGPQIDQLKESLDLSEEQSEKITKVLGDFRTSAEERFAELREQGFQGLDWRQEMQKFRERLDELNGKVREHLTPEQREKYEELLQNRPGFGRQNSGERGERSSRGRSPEQRLERVMTDMAVEDDEEKAAIQEIIKETMNADRVLNEYMRKMRDEVRQLAEGDLGEEAIDSRLTELRDTRRTHEKSLSTLRKELAEVVTYRQEAVLVRHGILK